MRSRAGGVPQAVQQSINILGAQFRRGESIGYRMAAKARYPGVHNWSEGPVEALRVLKEAGSFLALNQDLQADIGPRIQFNLG
jgi:hypothetical protein